VGIGPLDESDRLDRAPTLLVALKGQRSKDIGQGGGPLDVGRVQCLERHRSSESRRSMGRITGV
jgi:hypothetical protein